jgi:hypothetical protein
MGLQGDHPPMPLEQQPPLVLAMILADTVLLDVATGKNVIYGTYQALEAAAFPFTHPSIVVYVALTEGYGETIVRLRLTDVDELRPPIFQLETMVNFSDPFLVLEIVFRESKVVFPTPGEYRLQLFGADEPLLERRLQVGSEAEPDPS